MANRAISEDGVIALIDLKVKALEDKINENFIPDSTAEREWKAKKSAYNALKMQLKFIESYKFPTPQPMGDVIGATENIGSIS